MRRFVQPLGKRIDHATDHRRTVGWGHGFRGANVLGLGTSLGRRVVCLRRCEARRRRRRGVEIFRVGARGRMFRDLSAVHFSGDEFLSELLGPGVFRIEFTQQLVPFSPRAGLVASLIDRQSFDVSRPRIFRIDLESLLYRILDFRRDDAVRGADERVGASIAKFRRIGLELDRSGIGCGRLGEMIRAVVGPAGYFFVKYFLKIMGYKSTEIFFGEISSLIKER